MLNETDECEWVIKNKIPTSLDEEIQATCAAIFGLVEGRVSNIFPRNERIRIRAFQNFFPIQKIF